MLGPSTFVVDRPGAATVGVGIVGPKADLLAVEKDLAATEARLLGEGTKLVAVFFRVRDVSAVFGTPSFVRFARGFVDRTPSFQRAAVFVQRSFVVRSVVDPIAILAPRLGIKIFGELPAALAWVKEVDPTVTLGETT